jgi:hypothetical protein
LDAGYRFHDTTHGGKATALHAAILWRDEITAQHQPMAKRDYCNLLRSNNTSGIVGVRIQRNGKYSFWGR